MGLYWTEIPSLEFKKKCQLYPTLRYLLVSQLYGVRLDLFSGSGIFYLSLIYHNCMAWMYLVIFSSMGGFTRIGLQYMDLLNPYPTDVINTSMNAS